MDKVVSLLISVGIITFGAWVAAATIGRSLRPGSCSMFSGKQGVARRQRIVEEGEETDRRMTLTGVAARLALVALFLAIAVPNMPHQKDGPKTALAEFQPFLASVEAGQSKTSEASEKLLQRFIQWRQKSTSTPGP